MLQLVILIIYGRVGKVRPLIIVRPTNTKYNIIKQINNIFNNTYYQTTLYTLAPYIGFSTREILINLYH